MPLWHITKYDMHVTVWSEGVASTPDVRFLATQWAANGPDHTHCVRTSDTKGDITQ